MKYGSKLLFWLTRHSCVPSCLAVYKKHYPPSLSDEVWRLEKIGKDGAFHKRLSSANINTVKDFLTLLCTDAQRLRNVSLHQHFHACLCVRVYISGPSSIY